MLPSFVLFFSLRALRDLNFDCSRDLKHENELTAFPPFSRGKGGEGGGARRSSKVFLPAGIRDIKKGRKGGEDTEGKGYFRHMR